MQVDKKFDCAALPNLNDAFSDIGYNGFDPTPVDESMDMDVVEKETDREKGKEMVVWQAPVWFTSFVEWTLKELKPAMEEGASQVEKFDEPAGEGAAQVEKLAMEVDETAGEGPTNVDEPAGEGADTHGEVTYGDEDRVEVIFLDYEEGQDVVKAANIRYVFNSLKRKRKPGRFCTSPYTTPPDTTPKRRRSSRINRENPSPPNAPDFDDTLIFSQLEPFVENLSRTGTGKKSTSTVTVPCSIQKI